MVSHVNTYQKKILRSFERFHVPGVKIVYCAYLCASMQQVSNNHINSEYAPRQKHIIDANGTTIINAGVTPDYHFTYSSFSVSCPTGCTQFPLDVTTTRNGQIHQSAEAPGRRLSSASSRGDLLWWWHHKTSDDLHFCGLTCCLLYTSDAADE